MKKIDWDKVWKVIKKRRQDNDYYFMLPINVKGDIQSLVEAQLKVKRKK